MQEFDDTEQRIETVIPIHTITLKAFTSPHGRDPIIADEAFCKTTGEKVARFGLEDKVIDREDELVLSRQPSNIEGFSIAHLGDWWGNGLIAIWDDKTNKIIAGQADGIPYVSPVYRGKYLGREIQLKAFETGLKTIHDGSFFSPGGLACRKSAHRFAVQRAVEQGLDVSAEVLKDYPEFTISPKI